MPRAAEGHVRDRLWSGGLRGFSGRPAVLSHAAITAGQRSPGMVDYSAVDGLAIGIGRASRSFKASRSPPQPSAAGCGSDERLERMGGSQG